MQATTHTYCVYKEPKKIHVGRIFLSIAVIIVLFITTIKIMAIINIKDTDNFCVKADGRVLLSGQYTNYRGAVQVNVNESAWLINNDPMQPTHVYKWTSDSTKVDLGYVRFRAPLTSNGLYEFVSASQRRFVRLNWPEN